MKYPAIMFALVFVSPVATGQEWYQNAWNDSLTLEQLDSLSSGQPLSFSMQQKALPDVDEESYWPFDGNELKFGFFELQRDGTVCVDFGNYSSKCDVTLTDSGLRFTLSKRGSKFPIHFELGTR